MTSMFRLLSALLLVAAAGACGDDDTETSTASDTTTEPDTTTAPETGAAVELHAEPPEQVPAGEVTWEVEVTNPSDESVVLTFPTAQRADATLRTDDGTVVHQWSTDQFFAQQITEVTLEPGQTETFQLDDDLTGVEPGTYELVLELSAVDPAEPVVTQVEVAPSGS